MLRHLEEQSVIGSGISDPVMYYKWPLALHWRGRDDGALRLLGWIAHRSLTGEGDFASARAGFHQEFHSYANLWLTWAAAELGGSKLIRQTFSFLLKHQNAETGGLATNPTDKRVPYEDPLSTSFLGIVACALDLEDVARSVLQYLSGLLDKQAETPGGRAGHAPPGRPSDQAGQDRPGHFSVCCFWLRTLPDGTLVTEVPKGADPATFVIELGKREQCHYFFGAMCYFLARYMETSGLQEARELAHRIAGLLEGAGKEALSTIWAAKVGPGGIALYSVTGDDRYLQLAWPVVDAVLDAQRPEGCWLKDGQPWLTVSAEQCAWLTDIARRLTAMGGKQ